MKITEHKPAAKGGGFAHHRCAVDWLDPRNRSADSTAIVPQVKQAASKTQGSSQARYCFLEPQTKRRQRLEATRLSRSDQAAEEKKVCKVVCVAPGRVRSCAFRAKSNFIYEEAPNVVNNT